MLPLPFPNPPTMSSLSDARSSLETSIRSQEALATEISDAEANLAKVIQEAQCRIDALRREKTQLDEHILATQAYISPMRRLPIELLRDVFYGCFEDHPCCAWVLASVCVDWRRLALAMPRIWAKVSIPFRCSIIPFFLLRSWSGDTVAAFGAFSSSGVLRRPAVSPVTAMRI